MSSCVLLCFLLLLLRASLLLLLLSPLAALPSARWHHIIIQLPPRPSPQRPAVPRLYRSLLSSWLDLWGGLLPEWRASTSPLLLLLLLIVLLLLLLIGLPLLASLLRPLTALRVLALPPRASALLPLCCRHPLPSPACCCPGLLAPLGAARPCLLAAASLGTLGLPAGRQASRQAGRQAGRWVGGQSPERQWGVGKPVAPTLQACGSSSPAGWQGSPPTMRAHHSLRGQVLPPQGALLVGAARDVPRYCRPLHL